MIMKKLFFIIAMFGFSGMCNSQVKVLTNGNVGVRTATPSSTLHIKGTTSDNTAFTFKSDNSSGNELLYVRNDGYIGIGTASPGYQLTLGGTNGIFGIANTAYFLAKNSTGTYESYLWPRWSDNIMYMNYGSAGFNIRNNSSASTMFMTNAGFVGIGTTSPNNLLQVAGLINFNNTLYNTFLGYYAGNLNVIGTQNTYLGYVAGMKSVGSYNTSVGSYAGYNNTNGANVFMGQQAGYYSTGYGNTFIGYHTGWNNTIGNYNTLLGHGANVSAANLTNATAIGNGAIVNASNRVWIGDVNATVWTETSYNISDGRFKINVQENVKGLDFINKLRPVTYQMNTQQLDDFIIQNMPDSIKIMHQTGMNFAQSTAIVHSGFIAQEVDSAANASGFTSSIVSEPANSTDPYALAYAEIVVPLVKAVQELNATVTQQGLEIQQLKARLDECCKVTIPATGN